MKIADWYYDERADHEYAYDEHPHYSKDKSRAWESKLECMFDDWLQRPGGEYDALGEMTEQEYDHALPLLRARFESENDDEIQMEYFEWCEERRDEPDDWELDNSL